MNSPFILWPFLDLGSSTSGTSSIPVSVLLSSSGISHPTSESQNGSGSRLLVNNSNYDHLGNYSNLDLSKLNISEPVYPATKVAAGQQPNGTGSAPTVTGGVRNGSTTQRLVNNSNYDHLGNYTSQELPKINISEPVYSTSAAAVRQHQAMNGLTANVANNFCDGMESSRSHKGETPVKSIVTFLSHQHFEFSLPQNDLNQILLRGVGVTSSPPIQ